MKFEKDGAKVEMDVKGRITLGDQSLIVQAAQDGVGPAFVLEDFVKSLIMEGRLAPALSDWCPSFPGFFLYYPRQDACLRRCAPSSTWRALMTTRLETDGRPSPLLRESMAGLELWRRQ